MKYIGLPGVSFMAGITREGAWAGRRDASCCVLGEGANELAEAWAGRRDASCVLGEGANELAEATIITATKERRIMMGNDVSDHLDTPAGTGAARRPRAGAARAGLGYNNGTPEDGARSGHADRPKRRVVVVL